MGVLPAGIGQAEVEETVIERLTEASEAAMAAKAAELPTETWLQIEKNFLLQAVDHHWKEHLSTLDALRQVIHLRAYAQKTPLNEYKREAFALFQRMLGLVREDVTRMLAHVQFMRTPPAEELPPFIATHIDPLTGENDAFGGMNRLGAGALGFAQGATAAMVDDYSREEVESWSRTTSRNAECPCGSGKKFKHCHGAI